MIKSVGPVTLAGPGWVETVAFRSMHVRDQLSEPFLYDLELLSEDPNLVRGRARASADGGAPGGREPAPLQWRRDAAGAARMLGTYYHYRLVLRPWLWLLSKTSNCRIFQELSVPEIVKHVFRDHGFTDFDERLTRAYEPKEFVVQYRESDLNFVCRLLEHEAIYFFFEHTAELHMLIVCDASSAHSKTPFFDSLPYFPPNVNRDTQLEYVESWDAHGEYEVFDHPGKYKKDGGEPYALARLEELHAARKQSHGQSNARGLMTGALFTLAEHPVVEANRDHLLVSLDAIIRSHELESGTAESGPLFECRFTAIESDVPFRAPRITPKPSSMGASKSQHCRLTRDQPT